MEPQRREGRQGNTEEDRIAHDIIGAAIEVHRELGPGLLESAYQLALEHELRQRRIAFESQKAVPVRYKGLELEGGYRADLVVGGLVVVELKAVDALAPIHDAQMLSYLRMLDMRLGLLLNFHAVLMRDGIRRLAHRL